MEGEEVSRKLPEDLVEMILAMVPYPQIFKARVLSKSWLARLSPVSSHDDDGDEDKMRLLAVSFQKRLREYSTKWQTFSPAFVGNTNLIAYDWASHHWRIIPTLSFIPKNQLEKCEYSCMRIQAVRGALMLITKGRENLYVANVVTRSWKRLPPAPNPADPYYWGTLASEVDSYKVIQLFTDGGYLFGQIYDSQLGTWSCKRTGISTDLRFSFDRGEPGAESLNGVFYWLVFDLGYCSWVFLAFNVKEETFQVIQNIDIGGLLPDLYTGFPRLVVCSGSLLLASYNTRDDYTRIVSLVTLDLVSGRWLQVTRGPLNALKFGECSKQTISDGKSIFFQDVASNTILAYDVHKDEWSCFPTPKRLFAEYGMNLFSFQPGLNPFVAL